MLLTNLLTDLLGYEIMVISNGAVFVLNNPMIALVHSFGPLVHGRLPKEMGLPEQFLTAIEAHQTIGPRLMEIIIQPSAAEANKIAVRIMARLLREKPNVVLSWLPAARPCCFTVGLVTMNLDWRNVTTFNLDENVDLPREHPQSYHNFMWENLFQHTNIAKRNVHIPDGNAKDIPKFCAKYEQQIRAACGIDLQVLGIGTEGHIGFNEPTSSLASRTRIKTLTERDSEG